MSEMLKEFGKAILQFANIIGGIVLFKAFIETNNILMLVLAKGGNYGDSYSDESK